MHKLRRRSSRLSVFPVLLICGRSRTQPGTPACTGTKIDPVTSGTYRALRSEPRPARSRSRSGRPPAAPSSTSRPTATQPPWSRSARVEGWPCRSGRRTHRTPSSGVDLHSAANPSSGKWYGLSYLCLQHEDSREEASSWTVPQAGSRVRLGPGRLHAGRTAARVASTSRPICSISASSVLEDRLVPQPLPELDDQPLAVEIAGVVEQIRLDPPLGAAVVGIRADRDRGEVVERRPRRRSRSAGRSGGRRARGSRSDSRACRRAGRRRRRSRRARTAGRAAPQRPAMSPAAMAALIADDETPGTSGTSRISKPSRSSSSRSPRRLAPKRKSSPAATASTPIARRYDSANSSGSSRISSVVKLATSVVSTPSSASSSSRRSIVAICSTRLPRTMRGCGSNVTTVAASPVSITASMTAGDRDGRRRTFPWRPRAAAARPDPVHARSSRRGSVRDRRRRRAWRARRPPGRPLGVGLVDRERPDLEPPERPAVSAEHVRDRADVRPRRDPRRRASRCRPRTPTRSSASIRDRRTGISTCDAPPVQPVGALAADLDRRRGRDSELHLAAQPMQPRSSSSRRGRLVLVERRRPRGRRSTSGARRSTVGEVALVEPDEPRREPCRASRTAGRADPWRTGRACRRGPSARPCAGAPRRRSRTTTARPACRRGSRRSGREPAEPAPPSARVGARGARDDPRRDLLDREIRAEARGLPMPAATELARDRGHVELVDGRAQRDLAGGAAVRAAARGSARRARAPSTARR